MALDLAYQCSPDHPWVREHPEWFRHRPDGTIKYAENPPKKYQDIYPIDFECAEWRSLWVALKGVVEFWCARGVRIFRVDNPHTKAFHFWEWMIADVRRQYPDTIFLAEAFTRPRIMKYLAKLGFDQSYTYFTWRNTRTELMEYFTELTQTEVREYMRPNLFANTPDILHEYLQAGGPAAFRIRLVLAATLGATYGIYSGFELCENVPVRPGSEEYLDSEKYQVRIRDWDTPGKSGTAHHPGEHDPPAASGAAVGLEPAVLRDGQPRDPLLLEEHGRQQRPSPHSGQPGSAPHATGLGAGARGRRPERARRRLPSGGSAHRGQVSLAR